MKYLWKTLALCGALAVAGCTDSPAAPTPPSPELAGVPATITVPAIRGSAAGQFEFDADGTRRFVLSDDPIAGGGNCYDVCDGSGGSDGSGGDYGSDGGAPEIKLIAAFTEAHFERDILKGHAEMTFQFVDHAKQEMLLQTFRQDGSTLGSAKFTSGRIYAVPMLTTADLTSDGSLFAPQCDGRGFGLTQHDISISGIGRTLAMSGSSQSGMMYQMKCQQDPSTSGQPREEVSGKTPTGGLRVCHRLDHYSSTGEYIYTETLYCYDVYAS